MRQTTEEYFKLHNYGPLSSFLKIHSGCYDQERVSEAISIVTEKLSKISTSSLLYRDHVDDLTHLRQMLDNIKVREKAPCLEPPGTLVTFVKYTGICLNKTLVKRAFAIERERLSQMHLLDPQFDRKVEDLKILRDMLADLDAEKQR